jgi:hypothetical protein
LHVVGCRDSGRGRGAPSLSEELLPLPQAFLSDLRLRVRAFTCALT